MLFLNVLYNIVIRALGIFMRRTKATHNWCDWEYVCTYNLLLFPLSPCLCFSFLFFIFLLYFSFFLLNAHSSRYVLELVIRVRILNTAYGFVLYFPPIQCVCVLYVLRAVVFSFHYCCCSLYIPKSIFSSHFIPSNVETVRWIDENGTRYALHLLNLSAAQKNRPNDIS